MYLHESNIYINIIKFLVFRGARTFFLRLTWRMNACPGKHRTQDVQTLLISRVLLPREKLAKSVIAILRDHCTLFNYTKWWKCTFGGIDVCWVRKKNWEQIVRNRSQNDKLNRSSISYFHIFYDFMFFLAQVLMPVWGPKHLAFKWKIKSYTDFTITVLR